MIVYLKSVTKRYGKVEALRGIDLGIPMGQVVGLLGPNGAGTPCFRSWPGFPSPHRARWRYWAVVLEIDAP